MSEAGHFIKKGSYFGLCFWKCKVKGPHLVIAFLLAESYGGVEHHMAQDRECTYVHVSLLVSFLLIKPPGFNHGDSTLIPYLILVISPRLYL